MESAAGCRVARAAGVESEMELAFAGLHQLCAPFLDRLERLPDPQHDALGTAFGLRRGEAPDRFLVGLAVLTLLSDVAEERPLVCVVDDAQWLDRASAQALAFAARRLVAESVAVVFAMRDSRDVQDLTGLAELAVHGLADADARALLESVIAGPLDERVRDRIVAETHGNPLALLELPRGMTSTELAGGFGLPDATGLSSRIEESFRRRLTPLPEATRLLLLVAAAEPVGDPVALWRAAAQLGVGVDAAAPAVAAGLVELGGQVRFRHPLVRSAVYRAAPAEARRSVHRALAEATDPDVDPDRRAWHRAHATAALDEDVAAELERSAGRARARGGLAAAAAFLQRAAELTGEPERRARRALAAAQSKHQAGAPDAALQLLAMAQAGPLDELQRARAQLLRAQITFAVNRGRDAPPLLLTAAKRLEPLDARLARETYLDAFSAALFAGRLAHGVGVREVAEAVLAADWETSARRSTRASDLLLDGVAVLTTQGYAAGAPTLKRALSAFREAPMSERGRAALALARLPHRPRPGRRRELGRADRSPGAARPRRRRALAAPDRPDRAVRRAAVRRRARRGGVAGRGGGGRHRGDRQPPGAPGRHRAGRLARSRSRGHRPDRGRPAGSRATRRGAVADRHRVGERSALQRPRSLRGRARRRRAGVRASARAGGVDLGADRADRGRRPHRPPRARRRRRCGGSRRSAAPPAPTGRWGSRRAHERCSARARPPSASTARRSSGSAAPASASRSPAPICSTASGCAASAGASTPASSCAPPTRCSPRWGWRGSPSAPRRELQATGETVRKRTRRDARRAHRPGGADRAARARRALQPRDRRPAVHQPAHRRVAPAQGVRQARHQLAQRAPRGAAVLIDRMSRTRAPTRVSTDATGRPKRDADSPTTQFRDDQHRREQ